MVRKFFVVLFLAVSIDAFSANIIAKGRYFSLECAQSCDKAKIISIFNADFLVRRISSIEGSSSSFLSDSLDSLYLEVCDILDIHIYDYSGRIVVYPDKESLQKAVLQKLGYKNALPSFYLHAQNTIFIAQDSMSLEVLGHEIAHAVISHYFVVPPPAKLQEVLAGYVEYSIRKKRGTLP